MAAQIPNQACEKHSVPNGIIFIVPAVECIHCEVERLRAELVRAKALPEVIHSESDHAKALMAERELEQLRAELAAEKVKSAEARGILVKLADQMWPDKILCRSWMGTYDAMFRGGGTEWHVSVLGRFKADACPVCAILKAERARKP